MTVSGGTLSGTLHVNGLTTVSLNSTISPAGVGTIGTLNFAGGLTLQSGNAIQLDLGAARSARPISWN